MENSEAATPMGAEVVALYTMFANNGSGKLDFSAIIKMLRGAC
jgi:3-hydroxyisobutyrate dehydrogenase